jgi:lipopolysaccharide transport system permease protein
MMATRTEDTGWTLNFARRGLRGPEFRELWRFRELAYFLALRDVKIRYKQAAFGIGWAVLQPLLAMAVFTVVFGRIADVDSQGVRYEVFAYAGIAAWTYISTSVTKQAAVLVENSSLVTKIYFPRILAPLASALAGLIDLVLALSLMAILIPVYDVDVVPVKLLTVPLWLAVLIPISLCVGLWLSALNVRFRDVNHAVPFLIQLWLFISPVVYASSAVDSAWRYVYALNPTVAAIDGLRWALLDTPLNGTATLISLVSTASLLAGGVLYFQRSERRFADVI